MALKREIKDAYLEGGNSIYVKTHSNAVYIDENETETLTQRLDNVKSSIAEHTTQLNDNASYNLDLKDFNVYEDGVTDNTTAFANAIASAKTSGKIIKLKPITYVLSNLTIDGVHIDLNGATLKVSNNIVVKNGGIIHNGIIDGGGINSIEGKNSATFLTIRNFSTYAINLENGAYENIIDFIRLENKTKSSDTVGILINCSDNQIGHVYGHGCYTGIKVISGSDNYLNNIHLWLDSFNLYNGSTFINIKNGGSGNFFDNCCSDTYNNVLSFESTRLFASINNLFIIHNTILFPNVSINFTNVNNDFLKGDCTVKGTNWTKNNILCVCDYYSSIKFSFIDYYPPLTLWKTPLDEKLNGVGNCSNSSLIKINGDKIICNVTIFFSTEQDLNSSPFTLDISNMFNIKGFYVEGYGTCVGEGFQPTLVFFTLSNGIITVNKIPSVSAKILSLNLNFVGELNNYIN